jgi:MoxR-like ATPase
MAKPACISRTKQPAKITHTVSIAMFVSTHASGKPFVRRGEFSTSPGVLALDMGTKGPCGRSPPGETLKNTGMDADSTVMATTHAPSGARDSRHASDLARALHDNLAIAIRGKDSALRMLVAAVLSGGHVLVEDVPGVGKTLLAKSLARSLGGKFRRVQGTPDLLPADLTGVSVLDPATQTWRFRHGPLFANVVLVDEINRATPRTQSALLEAMEERQVTADGGTLRLPDPFVVIATQNPHEHAGTFPLVEGQRDRFTVVVELGLPGRDAERAILRGDGGVGQLPNLRAVATAEELRRAMTTVHATHVADPIHDYLLDLVDATRNHESITLGASPRASLSLLRLAQAWAVTDGRAFVTPDDIKAVAPPALAHRIILGGGPDIRRGRSVVESLLRTVPPPRG